MGDYLVVCRPQDDQEASHLSMDLAQDARDHGFRIVDLNTTTWAALRGPTPASITQVGNWTLLGDVFPRRRSLLSQRFGSNASASGDALFSSHWGRYAVGQFEPMNLAEDGAPTDVSAEFPGNGGGGVALPPEGREATKTIFSPGGHGELRCERARSAHPRPPFLPPPTE